MSHVSPWSRPDVTRPIARAAAPKPVPHENFFHSEARPDALQRFALLPLRAFVGTTFIYAGLQKVADPGYLDPSSGTYLGSQLQAFAASSPIGFLINWLAVPNVQSIGQAVIVAELGVGLLVLLGLFTRVAAVVGALLSVLLFLSATWDVQPYFLGSDTIYAVAWVTIALSGDGRIFSLEALLREKLRRRPAAPPSSLTPEAVNRRTLLLRAGGGLVGLVWLLAMLPKGQEVQAAAADKASPSSPPADPFRAESSATLNTSPSAEGAAASSSPAMIASAPASPAASAPSSPVAPASTIPVGAAPTRVPVTIAATPTPVPAAVPKAAATSGPAPAGTPITTMVQLQQRGGSLTFADRLTGEPGVLVDLGGGKVAACSAICTHAGCTVQYSARQRLLVCPCHGAVFDPAQSGRVLRGPARRPLAAIPVTASSDGTIYLQA